MVSGKVRAVSKSADGLVRAKQRHHATGGRAVRAPVARLRRHSIPSFISSMKGVVDAPAGFRYNLSHGAVANHAARSGGVSSGIAGVVGARFDSIASERIES